MAAARWIARYARRRVCICNRGIFAVPAAKTPLQWRPRAVSLGSGARLLRESDSFPGCDGRVTDCCSPFSPQPHDARWCVFGGVRVDMRTLGFRTFEEIWPPYVWRIWKAELLLVGGWRADVCRLGRRPDWRAPETPTQ